MIIKKRNKLINVLTNIIKENGHNQQIKQDLGNYFKERNLSSLRATWAWNENLEFNTLSDSEEDNRFLFLFTSALSHAGVDIKVEDYFTNTEIDRWKNYKEEDTSAKKIYPIVIPNVQILGDKIWQTKMTAQELNTLEEQNMLIYNFKTQRNPKITAAGERINIDVQKVKEIKESLINGTQFPDSIKLNILRTGEERISYDQKREQLIIDEGSIINIFDGYHRKTANSLALEENPDLQFTWSIIIVNFTERQAHDYMVQIDKQKPIKKEYIQQMDYNLPENLVVDSIIDDRLSELGKVMKDDDSYIRLNRALTKKSIIATAIKENYKEMLKSTSNIRMLARWIVEFTDYLMGLYVDEFINNPHEIKQTSYINHKNMFYGYIALSANLYKNKKWKALLKEKMASLDFSIDNPLWKDIGIHVSGDANRATRKKLYNLFKGGE